MASVLDTIPGYAGYRAQREANQQQSLADLLGMSRAQDMLTQQQTMQFQAQMQPLQLRHAQAQAALQDQELADQAAFAQRVRSGPTSAPQQAMAAGAASGSVGPTVSNAAAIPAQKQPTLGEQLMAFAQERGSWSLMQKAQAQLKAEHDARAKVSTTPQTVMKNGQPVLLRLADDGTSQEMPGYGPAEKLHFADSGQRTAIGIDQYTGKPVTQGVQKQQDPNSIASNASAAAGRAQAERHFQAGQNTPQYMETDAGLVALPKKLQAGQAPVGTPVLSPTGAPLGSNRPLTEAQGNATAFALRAGQALNELATTRDDKGNPFNPGFIDRGLAATPFGVGNGLMSDKAQQAMNAEKSYIAAVLRKESGAAISQGEYATYGPKFFPRPGDSDAVLAQKARNRALTEETLKAQAGPQYEKLAAKALSAAGIAPADTPAAADPRTVILPDGRPKTFPTPAAAQAFRKAAGL